MGCSAVTVLVAVSDAQFPVSKNSDGSRNYASTGPCSLYYQFLPPVDTGRRHAADPRIKLLDYQNNHPNPALCGSMVAPIPTVLIDGKALGAANANTTKAVNE